MVLIWKKLWGIWVYTWVRGIVIPGLGLSVCLFFVSFLYPLLFRRGAPLLSLCVVVSAGPFLPAFSSWAVRPLPPVRPRGGRVGFLPASGFSAPFLVGFSYVFFFLFRCSFGSCCWPCVVFLSARCGASVGPCLCFFCAGFLVAFVFGGLGFSCCA
mgnify:CR=1 FL=1